MGILLVCPISPHMEKAHCWGQVECDCYGRGLLMDQGSSEVLAMGHLTQSHHEL